jgi:uncharacterized protein YjbI with pentapeptide repeats
MVPSGASPQVEWASWTIEREVMGTLLTVMLVTFGIGGLVSLVLLFFVAPRMVPDYGLSSKDMLEALNSTRTVLLSGLTAIGLVTGAAGTVFTLGYTAESIKLTNESIKVTQDGQVTGRYTAAINQLAAERPEVKLGGIYALGRVMNDSPSDQRTVQKVLSAYIRSNAPNEETSTAPPSDIAAALDVITANEVESKTDVDLHGANLQEVELQSRRIDSANLSGVNFGGADFCRTSFAGSDLGSADFSGSLLKQANFNSPNGIWSPLGTVVDDGVNFGGAAIRGASFKGADLSGALFRYGAKDFKDKDPSEMKRKIRDNTFESVTFENAILRGADFTGARFKSVDFAGADLTGVSGLTTEQLAYAHIDDRTKLPPALQGARTATGFVPLAADIDCD